jgi:hypothetical protein
MHSHTTHTVAKSFAICIASFLLSGCVDFAQERQVASTNLQSFVGQPIQSLQSRLGPPDAKSEDPNGRLYTWQSSRDISQAIYTEGLMGANGKPVEYNPDSPALMKHERCTITTRTDNDGVIVRSNFHGSVTGACMVLFEKLKDPDKHPIYAPFP